MEGERLYSDEHPQWRENWRPWLRAKAIRDNGDSHGFDAEGEEEDSDRSERRSRRISKRRDDRDDRDENDEDDQSERQIIDTETGKPMDGGSRKHHSVYRQLKHLNKKSANIAKSLGETLKP